MPHINLRCLAQLKFTTYGVGLHCNSTKVSKKYFKFYNISRRQVKNTQF